MPKYGQSVFIATKNSKVVDSTGIYYRGSVLWETADGELYDLGDIKYWTPLILPSPPMP